jgi:hypothetical protein
MSKEITNEKIKQIYKLVEMTERNLDKLKDMLRNLDTEDKRDAYRDVPGITGIFDGVNLLSEDGKKLEVPANYAAKSRLVFGDSLKLIEEDGKQVFKQIEKIERKKVEGILTRKEGKWYIISDSGTYKISDIAAEYQHAELNDEAVAFVPANNLNSPYAALDKVNKKTPFVAPIAKSETVAAPVAKKEAPAKPKAPRAAKPTAPKVDNRPQISEIGSNSSTSKPKPRPAAKVENTKEFVDSLGAAPAPKGEPAPTGQYPTPATKSLDEDDLR